MKNHGLASRLGGLLSLLFVLLGLSVVAAPASSADPGCVNGGVLSIFARGSQGSVNFQSAESSSFYHAVQNKLGGLPFQQVDLGNIDGDNTLERGEYPAVGMADWGILSGLNGYYASVGIGATELATYLEKRSATCPNEVYLLGGYSQGAEVVGYAITAVDQRVRDQIGYVALFGDPRFNPGCINGHRASSARGSAGCTGGVLGARQPYLPTDLVNRTGSWCDADDGICSRNPARLTGPLSTHAKYPAKWIPEAGAQAAPILRSRLGWAPLPTF
ncbi:cutinase family protein [Frankia sp. AgB1.9]|uniref:cutinase family protein n=1 Tax=unclassified Frankia TaxID=2632575 RepID=UPI00193315C7|nr:MULTISPECIES: cutinase family protein [unclassified Frankia]MBL7490365.1 cutinase family protein [Frankia sp. AgW1.1]MBL7548475.1 cutinase family protein [Frankia sp. AgB1.9]MBL7621365.1 cutinase family protein [Frankia sp. AgB1.8]